MTHNPMSTRKYPRFSYMLMYMHTHVHISIYRGCTWGITHILLWLGGNRLKPCTFTSYQTEIEGSSKNPKNSKEGKTMAILKGSPKKGRPSKKWSSGPRVHSLSGMSGICCKINPEIFDIAGDGVNAGETGADHFYAGPHLRWSISLVHTSAENSPVDTKSCPVMVSLWKLQCAGIETDSKC